MGIVFEHLLGFVNFDALPTEELVDNTFSFENIPLSETVGQVGYESRIFIVNIGSIPIYFLVSVVLQLLYGLLTLCCPKVKRVQDFA